MTPREYLDTICRPNLKEFRAQPSSIRRAWNSAVSMYHFVDCVAISRVEKVETIQKQLQVAFPKLRVLADIANANKHFALGRGLGAGLTAQHFEIGLGAAFSDGTYWSDGTSFSDAPEVVRVQFNGEIIDVHWLCEAALTAWEKVA